MKCFNFSVDSNTVLTSQQRDHSNWSSSIGAFPAPFNHPFYIIMNLAVGGQFVGSPNTGSINAATTFPGDMQIDYIRVYQDLPIGPPLLLSVLPATAAPVVARRLPLPGIISKTLQRSPSMA